MKNPAHKKAPEKGHTEINILEEYLTEGLG
jgi:hypothetical protein